jgi:hypothetical protein
MAGAGAGAAAAAAAAAAAPAAAAAIPNGIRPLNSAENERFAGLNGPFKNFSNNDLAEKLTQINARLGNARFASVQNANTRTKRLLTRHLALRRSRKANANTLAARRARAAALAPVYNNFPFGLSTAKGRGPYSPEAFPLSTGSIGSTYYGSPYGIKRTESRRERAPTAGVSGPRYAETGSLRTGGRRRKHRLQKTRHRRRHY